MFLVSSKHTIKSMSTLRTPARKSSASIETFEPDYWPMSLHEPHKGLSTHIIHSLIWGKRTAVYNFY
jgi:hypothetical protein